MNRFEKFIGLKGEAKIHYMANDFQIVSPGQFVKCAVTNQAIPVNDLCYWSADLQEAYVSAEVALQRYREVEGV